MRTPSSSRRWTAVPRHYIIASLLGLVTLAVYAGVLGHDFVNYDDNLYVTANADVQRGLTVESMTWACTTGHSANWHPLTWLSHMLDVELYGLDPSGHHLSSVILHVANTLLLFVVLRRMTKADWQSGFVAALFALHPLHVESVAWIAERKDVLSTLFWMLTMLAYVRYAERPGLWRYVPVAISLALGLMSKPMLVTLPLVLLLLDYWPLGRFQNAQKVEGGKQRRRSRSRSSDFTVLWKLVSEKIPLFVLVGISSVVTYIVQQSAGAMVYGTPFPLGLRIGNAILSYLAYLQNTFWPANLAVLYPHRGMGEGWQVVMLPAWQVLLAASALVVISILAVRQRRRYPFAMVGWFWYVVTLVPVLGLIQVGTQAMADRYTYVPLIGAFAVLAWGLPLILERLNLRRLWPGIVVTVISAVLAIISWQQIGHWKNSITLFEHTVEVTQNNPVAHYNLGFALHQAGRYDEAATHYREALRLAPTYTEAHTNLTIVLQQKGDAEAAAREEAQRGAQLGQQGRLEEAIARLEEALRLKPDFSDAHNNLGIILAMGGDKVRAKDHFSRALASNPDNWNAHYNLGMMFAGEHRYDEAVMHYRAALRIRPDYPEAQAALDSTLRTTK